VFVMSLPAPKSLTADGGWKLAPCFAPDGRSIVFCAHVKPNLVALVRLVPETAARETVFPSVVDHQFDPAISPDARLVAFAMSASSPQLVLSIRDLRERTESQFRPRDARATARTPRFTPDGRRIVFCLSDEGGQQIASVDRGGKDLKRLTASAGTSCWPSISPDGREIVFSSSREGHFQLYVMNADGSGVRRLSHSATRDMRPAWSPDGRWIAYVGTRGGNHDIHLVRPDGSETRRLTDSPERDDFPAWSPDSRRLVTLAQRSGAYDLLSYDVSSIA
jgi:tol-pal system beta propeller repeat protein TolB